jgi:hypothetical protein
MRRSTSATTESKDTTDHLPATSSQVSVTLVTASTPCRELDCHLVPAGLYELAELHRGSATAVLIPTADQKTFGNNAVRSLSESHLRETLLKAGLGQLRTRVPHNHGIP